MAYDQSREETVLFGGYGDHGYLRDTWTWDGSVWTRETPTHSPPREYEPTMAYDSRNGVVVLFGNDDNDARADTWIWDGSDWRRAQPSFSPVIRSGAGIAYDSISGRVILFGGVDDLSCGDTGCADFRDTFSWDGLTWTKLHPHPEPDKRSYMGMAQDPLTGGVVLFGGVQDFLGGAIFGDTWEWDGSNWGEVRLNVRPPRRDGMAMAYLPASNQVVMFGGTAYGTAWYDDTWLWDGSSWSHP
jgi:hypothetical protein